MSPRHLRSEQQLRLEQPRARSKKDIERAFSVAVLSLCNDPPLKVKQADTLDLFKSQLKAHLFMNAFTV